MQQVFFTCVPDKSKVSLAHPWIWILRYASSSYQATVLDLDVEYMDHNQDDAEDIK